MGLAICSLRLHEYVRGLDSIRDAIDLLDQPSNRDEEQARVLAEATYVQLLLATNKVSEASDRAEIARSMAERAKSVRATRLQRRHAGSSRYTAEVPMSVFPVLRRPSTRRERFQDLFTTRCRPQCWRTSVPGILIGRYLRIENS